MDVLLPTKPYGGGGNSIPLQKMTLSSACNRNLLEYFVKISFLLVCFCGFSAAQQWIGKKQDTSDADFINVALSKANTSDNVLFRPICKSRIEFVRPGDSAKACNTTSLLTLRYWQPYRALRRVICDQSAHNPLLDLINSTYAEQIKAIEEQRKHLSHEPQCADVFPGAECIQKYQQFLVLVNLGVSSSGWACVELESGCDCSIKPLAELTRLEYVQFLLKPPPPKPGDPPS